MIPGSKSNSDESLLLLLLLLFVLLFLVPLRSASSSSSSTTSYRPPIYPRCWCHCGLRRRHRRPPPPRAIRPPVHLRLVDCVRCRVRKILEKKGKLGEFKMVLGKYAPAFAGTRQVGRSVSWSFGCSAQQSVGCLIAYPHSRMGRYIASPHHCECGAGSRSFIRRAGCWCCC